LRLEFRAPALLYNDAASDIFALFARAQDLPLAGLAPYGNSYRAALDESEPVRDAALHGRQMAIAREARDYDAAIAEGEQAVAADPHDVALRAQLSRAYLHRASRRYHRRDPGGAQDDLANVVELRPGPAELFRAHAVLGDMDLARNDFGGAAREYGAALQIARDTDSPAPELHARMAQVLAALGDFVHAAHELDRAIRESTDPARLEQFREMRDTVSRRAPF
jgi:tetratricopeptide (TPR) repeat protein